MERLNTTNCIELLCACRDEINKNVPFLCQLDSFVGDGDHGLTVSRGFESAYSKVSQASCASPYHVFNSFSKELGRSMGGAIGPIFQSIFLGMSNAIKESDTIGAEEFLQMQKKGLQSVMIIGGAKVGDRTLVDAFSPALDAYSKAFAEGGSFESCIQAAAAAAEDGCRNTAKLIARKGRAKFLGEKSLGHQDAGATSMSFIYKAMSDYISQA